MGDSGKYTITSRYFGNKESEKVETTIDLTKINIPSMSPLEFAKLNSIYAEIASAQENLLKREEGDERIGSLNSLTTTFTLEDGLISR